jgi:hypothetical protein
MTLLEKGIMTVAQLITELEKLEPSLPVVAKDWEGEAAHVTSIEILSYYIYTDDYATSIYRDVVYIGA